MTKKTYIQSEHPTLYSPHDLNDRSNNLGFNLGSSDRPPRGLTRQIYLPIKSMV